MLEFEWNNIKAVINLKKHGVSFREARTAFADPFSLTIHDQAHSEGESRYLLLGVATTGRLFGCIAYTSKSTNSNNKC